VTAQPTTTRGRPRRPETDSAINAATRQLLVSVGYGDLTMEGVAKRAGVGKPTVYRRHASKASLVAAALVDTLATVNPSPPDTGDANADLRLLLGNLAEALTSSDFGRAITEIVSPAARDGDLAGACQTAIGERRILIRTIFERAAFGNSLVSVDVETAIDMALGAIYFRHLITHERIDDDFIAGLVDSLIAPIERSTAAHQVS